MNSQHTWFWYVETSGRIESETPADCFSLFGYQFFFSPTCGKWKCSSRNCRRFESSLTWKSDGDSGLNGSQEVVGSLPSLLALISLEPFFVTLTYSLVTGAAMSVLVICSTHHIWILSQLLGLRTVFPSLFWRVNWSVTHSPELQGQQKVPVILLTCDDLKGATKQQCVVVIILTEETELQPDASLVWKNFGLQRPDSHPSTSRHRDTDLKDWVFWASLALVD